MRSTAAFLVVSLVVANLLMSGCTQAAPEPTKAPPAPTKAAEPTKAPAAAAPTKAPEPTAVPTAARKLDYPVKGKPITIIIPWAAGGSTDVSARLVAAALEKELGTPVQPVNKPGGGSQVGLAEIAIAKPDGYTLGLTNMPTTIVTYIDPDRKATYDRKSFEPIANLVSETNAMVVKTDSPFKSFKDLLDAARAKPGGIKAGTTGFMTSTHMDLVVVQKVTGVEFALVHFDSGGPATTALMGGHVDVITGSPANFAPQFKAGEVRGLAIMDKQENRYMPGVKTMEAQGYKVYRYSTRSLSAPAGTPKEIVDLLSAAIKKVMATDDFKKKMEDMSLEPVYMDAAELARYWGESEAEANELVRLAKQTAN